MQTRKALLEMSKQLRSVVWHLDRFVSGDCQVQLLDLEEDESLIDHIADRLLDIGFDMPNNIECDEDTK